MTAAWHVAGAAAMAEVRARRSCLSVPGSSPRMLAKAPGLPADQVMLDLEDSVAPAAKAAARASVVAALREAAWGGKTVSVRVNAPATAWCHADIVEVVSAAGQHIDSVIVPKVASAQDVTLVAGLLRMVEEGAGLARETGIEAQIEDAAGLSAVREIAAASPRLQALIFGPGDMAASLGMPLTSIGEASPHYPGDQWHWVLMTILVAARAAGLAAIDGPFGRIRDPGGFRAAALRSYSLGYDGKWVLHPDQIAVANEVFTPTQEDFDTALAMLETYEHAAGTRHTGAVNFGGEMIDEASRKMAERLAVRGRAAGLARGKTLADFQSAWRDGRQAD
jgi:citrate lyase subunit beta / citryl-CoA lyase